MRRPRASELLIAEWLAPLMALLLATVQASADTEVADTQPYEINALRAQNGSFDYVARVHANPSSSCTGTLISPHVVLTSAHCFGGFGSTAQTPGLSTLLVKNTSVQFGYNVGELHTAFATPSTAVATHPYYGLDGLRYDIAVIRIDTSSLPFAPTPAAHLAKGPIADADYGKTVTSIGWGRASFYSQNLTTFLRDVNLTLSSPSEKVCQGYDPADSELLQDGTGFCMVGAVPSPSKIGTLPPPTNPELRRGICYGDSGGPVILPGSHAGNDTLIGINSYLLTNATGDVTCGDPTLGEVATSVGAYSAFLNATLREFEDGKPPLVNITSLNISHIDYGRHGLESTGQVSFLASMDITTNYLMVRNALYDGNVLAQQPGMALRTYSPSRNVSTLVPFRLYDFDASSFTFTFRVSNVQVVTGYSFDLLDSHMQTETSFKVFFRAFGELHYSTEVAEVSTTYLQQAISAAAAHGSAGPFDSESAVPQLLLSSLAGQLT